MEVDTPKISSGLEGIYITNSNICKVDGINGRLWYRGYSIEALAENSNFEEVSYLLIYGALPDAEQMEAFSKKLKQYRELSQTTIDILSRMVGRADPMDILRTAISALPADDKDAYENSDDQNARKSIMLISKVASITATIGRMLAGKTYVKPNGDLDHASNFLYMLNGSKPNERDSKVIDLMLVLHAEHATNASTFSAMVTGSTLADIYAAVTSGIATLKGPLHGGADENALKMMREIGTPANTEKYIDDALAGKKRIMGFGHRVYKTYDPRAKIIKKYLIESEDYSDDLKNLAAIALRAETLMIGRLGKTHGIWPNVDFFSGPVYLSIGIPLELFTPLFAVARTPGWCAHVLEYWKNNRLFRPLDFYTGALDIEYKKISER
ncbi:citrate/2-methylcitrate synthase [Candidatus Marsarchaeota archaeon]|jgi:citrate synthase|nr:citrate/2-methylcitrate synthase [Candidatus Marsarchaeota archaeon]MCL5092749.1 citrate/2-methylcitrate synthase [Candidatus Marsarchaeota archaeon]